MKPVFLDCDQEADVLYLSFKRPRKATAIELLEDEGILSRHRGKERAGITILEASTYKQPNKKS